MQDRTQSVQKVATTRSVGAMTIVQQIFIGCTDLFVNNADRRPRSLSPKRRLFQYRTQSVQNGMPTQSVAR
ncbi:hypothetical protein DND90_16645 [Pseudomonas syringae pv. maculicola]|nr:hypothetical protein DND90_16645 [Pseudomonas syringae pv. maculicola]